MAKGKSEYWMTKDGLLRLAAYARDGLTDDGIARKMGISRSTLCEWKNRYPDISDTLKEGKEVVDVKVENALLKRALGYEYDEVSEKYEGGNLTEKKVTRKRVVPDTTAQIFWLKNRRPDIWREKVVMEAEADRSVTVSFRDAVKGCEV